MNAFQARSYILVENEEYYGGTSIVRKYRKGREYYAIKEIRDDSDYPMERIDNEINILINLHHPNIIALKEWFVSPMEMGVYKCIVMEWCEENMQNYVDANPTGLTVDEMHYFVNDIMKGLDYIVNKQNLLHRDIKLTNFLLKRSKEYAFPIVKICDFGSAIPLNFELTENVSSPLFAAPEIKSHRYTSKVDIWSLGCALYWMACGHTIYNTTDAEEFLLSLENNQAIDFSIITDLDLRELLQKMLIQHVPSRADWPFVFKSPYVDQSYYEKADHPGEKSHYQLLSLIGRGSFGTVHKAWDTRNQRYVAIKKIYRKDVTPETLRLMALREIRIVRLFQQTNICRFIDYYIDSTIIHFVMEYCDAGDLQQLLDARRRNGKVLTDTEISAFARDILRGIRYLHEVKHFAHRDIKPSNMLLARSLIRATPVVKIADLGLAKRDNYVDPLKTHAGTPAYMAPEVRGGRYTYESDLWSMGCVFFTLATGQLIFSKKKSPPFEKMVCRESIVELTQHLVVYDTQNRWGWNEILKSSFWNEPDDGTLILKKDGAVAVEVVKRMATTVKRMSVEEMIGVMFKVSEICQLIVDEINEDWDGEAVVSPIFSLFECTRDITYEALSMMEATKDNEDWRILLTHARSMFRVLVLLVGKEEKRIIEKILRLIEVALVM
ncbi:Calcium/calmodulin-dependent protein kinase type [Entamoeba marina]